MQKHEDNDDDKVVNKARLPALVVVAQAGLRYHRSMPTELDDLNTPLSLPVGVLSLDREARLLATHRHLLDSLGEQQQAVQLVSDELFHPQPPCDLVVRRGNLRVTELLDDGREVTRAVLQAGGICRVREDASATVGDDASSPLYSLARTVLMALGETELWQLPSGVLDSV